MSFDVSDCIAFASFVVSVSVAVFTYWQISDTKKYNRLSVRPFLMTAEHNDVAHGKGYAAYELLNCGAGAAIIKDFILLYGDEEVSCNNPKAYESFLEKKLVGFSSSAIGHLVPGSALPAGGKHSLLAIKYDVGKQDLSEFEKLNVIINYQSLYQEEIFSYDSRKDREWSKG